ncbi:hypothetical protein ACWEWX_15770 [Streptomyces asiaticus]
MVVKPTANSAMTAPTTMNMAGVPIPAPIPTMTGMDPITMDSGALKASTVNMRWNTPRLPRSPCAGGSPVGGSIEGSTELNSLISIFSDPEIQEWVAYELVRSYLLTGRVGLEV